MFVRQVQRDAYVQPLAACRLNNSENSRNGKREISLPAFEILEGPLLTLFLLVQNEKGNLDDDHDLI